MSYSFSVKASNKSAAKEAVAAKFDEVLAVQPIHQRDKDAALANVNSVIDLLADDLTRDVSVSVNGYVGWKEVLREDCSNPLQNVSISACASYIDRLLA